MKFKNGYSKYLPALSWKIETEPKLYRELVSNPYTSRAREIISKRFPDFSIADVVRAVVLAEPEGKYDWNFNRLPKPQQEKELSKQNELFTQINERLAQYCLKYAKELKRLPKEFVYESLSLVVFETADFKKIEQRYSQKQRRDFRLAIVNFIEKINSSAIGRPFLKVVFAALSLVLLFSLFQGQTQNINPSPKVEKQVLGLEVQKENPGLPTRLIIPAIKINAKIQPMGVTQTGAMAVPNNAVDVGWFKSGPRPGEKGSAVMAGHFDGENGETGVFTNLYTLKRGDKLYIENDQGMSLVFVVRESRLYDPGYADDIFSQSDSVHLNLVTCDGVWNGVQKSYSKRLVVFADLLGEE